MTLVALSICPPLSFAESKTSQQEAAPAEKAVAENELTQAARETSTQAAEFTLEDQYREQHEFTYPREKVCVLLFADQDGSKQIEGWVKALHARYEETVDIHGVALLKAAPALLRPTLRLFFRQRVEHPVMLDWDGSVTEKFACKAKQVSLFVLDTNGIIQHTEYGAAETEALEKVVESVDKTMKAPKTNEKSE